MEFGQRMGLPAALSALPLAPLASDYRALVALQRDCGVRHAGEALVRRGGRLRVLDGLFASVGQRGWRRVDADELRSLQAERPSCGGLLSRLAEIDARDVTALRRVVLYQLLELLHARPPGPDGRTAAPPAAALGVDAGECRALVRAAELHPRLSAAQRAAVELLPDARLTRELRRAAELARPLAPLAGHDHELDRLVRGVADDLSRTDRELRAARRAEAAGEEETARAHCLRAVQLCADDPGSLRGLVRTHRPAEPDPAAGAGAGAAAGTPAATLLPELTGATVRLTWPELDGTTEWRILRLTRTEDGPATVSELGRVPGSSAVGGGDADNAAEDSRPPLGQEVRYASLPLRDGLLAGAPRVSRPLLVAPEVAGLTLAAGRGQVAADWLRPPGAEAVVVVRTGPDGRRDTRVVGDPGATGANAFTAHDLAVGEHTFRISCRYRTPSGRDVESAGVEARCTVERWPEPVRELTATPDDRLGGVRFSWTGGEDAEVRLVEWPDAVSAPEPGGLLASTALPAPLAWSRAQNDPDVLLPPPGELLRVSAVSVLGNCAVMGPGVSIRALVTVTALRAERLGRDSARVVFEWPTGAGLVRVCWEQDGARQQRSVSRSAYLREGLRLPVGPSRVRLTAGTAHPESADVTTVVPAAAETMLPADIALSYRLVPPARLSLRKRSVTVQIELSAPNSGSPGPDSDADAPELPEFVLVARTLDGRGTVRPRHPADGTTLLRLSGAQLRRPSRGHEIPLDACRRPYAVRGFLIGEQAAVRLEEPSPTSLVVR